MFGRIVMGVEGEQFDHALDAAKARGGVSADTDLTADDLRALVAEYRSIVETDDRPDFPSDPYEQLDLAIKAVFASWFGRRAPRLSRVQQDPDDLGTAVNVVTMVFGNMGDDSGTGVAFTRDPEHRREGALRRVPDECAGRGRRRRHPHPARSAISRRTCPRSTREFERIAERLEQPLQGHSGPRVHRSSAAACSCCRRAAASARRPPP